MLPNDFCHITGIILTCIVGLKSSRSDPVGDQALGTLRFCYLCGSVIKDHIDNINLGAVDYGKKIEEAQKNGDITAVAYYTRLKAQAEAEAKGE